MTDPLFDPDDNPVVSTMEFAEKQAREEEAKQQKEALEKTDFARLVVGFSQTRLFGVMMQNLRSYEDAALDKPGADDRVTLGAMRAYRQIRRWWESEVDYAKEVLKDE